MSDLASLSDDELLRRLNGAGTSAPSLANPAEMSDADLLKAMGGQQAAPAPAAPAWQQNLSERDKKLLGAASQAGGSAAALAQGTAKGLGDVGRGFGLLDQLSPAEKAKFDALAKQYPEANVGEILGQVAPWLVPGAAAARIASLPLRMLASGAVGGSEGFVVTKGQGGTNAEAATMAAAGVALGNVAEGVAPLLNRSVSAVGRALGFGDKALVDSVGNPTAEFKAALDKAGISFDDISKTAQAELAQMRPGTNTDQAARLARFRSEGIEPTTGQVTQDFSQQAQEARLASMATGPDGEPLRQRLLDQSQQFENRVTDLVKNLGVTPDAGTTIKEALSGRKKLLRKEKNDLYAQVAKAAPEVANAPILTDTIVEAMADKATKRRISRLAPNQVSAVDDLLIEFGLDQSPDAVAAFVKEGGEINPLTLGNFEEFRQALNLIERTDQSGAVSVLTGPIKEALDEEAALIDGAVKNSGLSDVGVLDTLKEARQRVRDLKTDFSPQSIVGRLIDVKRDGVTPVIEASQITRRLVSSTAPIEELNRVVSQLEKSGEKGAKAIADLQGAAVMQALEAALKAPSRKTSGVQTISGNQFAKALDELGEDRLAVIFRGNEDTLKRVQNLRQIALDIEPASAATPKGSAPVILDAMKRIGRLPGVAPLVDTVNFIVNAGADDRAVARALRGKPEMVKNARMIVDTYPGLASALGLGVILNMDKENAPQR